MEPQIQYAKTEDGVSIAYWTMGEGMPFVHMPPFIFSHLQLEWQDPDLRRWYERLAARWKLVRFDPRGMGLSDRDVTDYSLEAYELDLEAVADRLGLDKFALFALGGIGRPAIAYAVGYPERVSHLVLSGTHIRSQDVLPTEVEDLLSRNWELYTETMAHIIFGWSRGEEAHRWAEFIRASVTQEDMQGAWVQVREFDVRDLLPHVAAPTLLLEPSGMHGSDEGRVRTLASGIPDARVVHFEAESPNLFVGDTESVLHAISEFLGDAQEATPEPEAPSGTAIILFLDIAGSTALTTELGDAAYREKERELDISLRAAITEAGGTPVEGKVLGDGVMAVFTSARQAIGAAQRCRELGNEAGLPLHLGIHAGDVVREGNNVHGGAVQVASRVQSAAAPGEILVSDIVRGLARTSAGVAFEDRGEHMLKGIPEPQRLYAVRWREQG